MHEENTDIIKYFRKILRKIIYSFYNCTTKFIDLVKMISQNQIKLINSLAKKKYRDLHHLFIAEGHKLVLDLLNNNYPIQEIYATGEWFSQNPISTNAKKSETDIQYLKKISQLKTAPPAIAICPIPEYQFNIDYDKELILVLDNIQDPGNLGTIIRLADWFGINHIVCSDDTVDVYNPKVVQATMGAIARVKISYTNLNDFFKSLPETTPIYGTFLDGENIYEKKLSTNGIIVMGNEGKGISSEVETFVTQKLLIPNFSNMESTSESLNVSMATAITLSEFRRTGK